MVDSINPSGPAQAVPAAQKKPETQKQDKTEKSSSPAIDEVTLSQEALSLSQAEETARQVSSALAQRTEATLSADQQRLSTLV